MKILLSNDDGVYAPGLWALFEAVRDLGDIFVVAPDRNCSAMSQSLTLQHPIRVQTVTVKDTEFMAVQGTPTDSVHLALMSDLIPKPDLVLSGINQGANLGDDVLYSGTVAAAIEAHLFDIPAIAVSLVGHDCQYYQTAGTYIRSLVEKIKNNQLDIKKQLWNINVPDCPSAELAGFKVCRLGHRHRAQKMIEANSPRDEKIYWVGLPGEAKAETGGETDFEAVKQNFVSITPLRVDLTEERALSQTRRALLQLNL